VLDGPGGVRALGQNGAIVVGGVHTTVVLPSSALRWQLYCFWNFFSVFTFLFFIKGTHLAAFVRAFVEAVANNVGWLIFCCSRAIRISLRGGCPEQKNEGSNHLTTQKILEIAIDDMRYHVPKEKNVTSTIVGKIIEDVNIGNGWKSRALLRSFEIKK
jgi:hypothetical protein